MVFCRLGWVAVDISLFLTQLGFCCTYLIFVSDNIRPMLKDVLPSAYHWLAGTAMLMLYQVPSGEQRYETHD